jgi:hypothetical protein
VSERAGLSRRELGEGEGRKRKVRAGGEQVRGQQRQQRQKLSEGHPKNISATRVFCDLLVKQTRRVIRQKGKIAKRARGQEGMRA